MSASEERQRAIDAARTDFREALTRARKVSDPWYRCQSLAYVARYAPEGDVLRVANEAVKAGKEGKNAYKQAAVCAWPLCALAERGKTERAEKLVAELLPLVASIDHPVSRMDALLLLWEAAVRLPHPVEQSLFEALLAACSAANSWKVGRTMQFLALVRAAEDPAQAEAIVDAMKESPYKRQARKALAAGKTEQRRVFV